LILALAQDVSQHWDFLGSSDLQKLQRLLRDSHFLKETYSGEMQKA